MLQVIPGIRYKDLERILEIVPGNPAYANVDLGFDVNASFEEWRLRKHIKGKEVRVNDRIHVDCSIQNPSKEDLLKIFKATYEQREGSNNDYHQRLEGKITLKEEEARGEERKSKRNEMPISIESIFWSFNDYEYYVVSGKRTKCIVDSDTVNIELPHGKLSVHLGRMTKSIPKYAATLKSEIENRIIYVPELEFSYKGRTTQSR